MGQEKKKMGTMGEKVWAAKGHTKKEVQLAIEKAFSVNDDGDVLKLVGYITRGERVWKVWADSSGNYWYSLHFRVKGKIISEEEKIFGRKLLRRSRRIRLETMRQRLKKE